MLEELIINNNPVLYLHNAEKDFPVNVDHYLNNVNVLINSRVVLQQPTQTELYRFSQESPHADKAYLKITSTRGKLGDSTLNSECYGIVRDFNNIYVTYVYFYPYNSATKVLGLAETGEHFADIEHVTIEFDRTYQPVRYYFSAHGSKDGAWYTPEELDFENQRPVVYVAKGSHAGYNKPGVYPRFFGAVTDETNKGFRWAPNCRIIWEPMSPSFTENNSWFFYPGKWGDTGIRGVVEQQWFKRLPTKSRKHVCVSQQTWTFISWFTWLLYLLTIAISGTLISYQLTESNIESMVFLILYSTSFHGCIKLLIPCCIWLGT